jgi:hypothetical protein
MDERLSGTMRDERWGATVYAAVGPSQQRHTRSGSLLFFFFFFFF